ncbi:MAG: NAD(P)-dependent alcohol dehydrogenase, partial [Candidatus Woesearchaeota archaeon]
DIHYYNEGKIGNFIVKKPLILGHESAGEIMAVGKKSKFKVGDRVALEPGVPCRKCDFCKQGKYNLCSNVKFMATPPIDGAFTEYLTHPSDFAYKLPENLSYDEGALIEPLSVGIHAAERVGIKPAMNVVILGAGTIGISTLQVVKNYGAKVVITDINDYRLKIAKKLGADKVINVSNSDAKSEIEKYYGNGVDVVLETAGTVNTTQLTIELVKKGGKIAIVGLAPTNNIKYDIVSLSTKEVDLYGIFRYRNTYKKAIDLVKRGKINLKKMITHSYNLSETKKAIEFANNNKDKSLKIMIRP